MRDHLEASLGYTLARLGSHGLPLIGRADWNDCLNLNAHSTNPDESFQTAPMRTSGRAESVMIAALFVLAAREYAALAAALKDDAAAAKYRAAADAMAATVETHGWDGEWFLRAYDHAGRAVGSAGNDEGQIFLEPQALCAMAGIGAATGLVDRALQSVSARLASAYGVRLLDPPYRSYHGELGEISTYLPGYKENGSVFCHTNPWLIIAEAMRGRADRAMQVLRSIAPTYQSDRGHAPHRALRVRTDGRRPAAASPGEAKNSWLTGTASWSHTAVTQHILGLRASVRGTRRRSLHSRGLAVLQHAPGVPRRALRDRGTKRPRQRPWRAQPHRRRQGRPRQCHSTGGAGHDGPGDGRARLTWATRSSWATAAGTSRSHLRSAAAFSPALLKACPCCIPRCRPK